MSDRRLPGGQALSLRARLAVAAYVVFTWPVMTAFLFGPLAALIAVSRPQGRKARLWLAALLLWLALWAAQSGDLVVAAAQAAALLSTGIGVLFLLLSPGSVSTRALRGTAAVVVGSAGLWAVVGLQWGDVVRAVAQQGPMAQRAIIDFLNSRGTAPTAATLDAIHTLGEGVRAAAPYFPGVLALMLFAGLCLAALLAPRIAGSSLAPIPGRFDDFRFSDHLVWLVIVGLVGLLFSGGTPVAGPTASLLAFGVGLYALRGTAILSTALRAAPTLFIVMLVVGALFLLPFAVGGLALLGLADTWLDFRRRMAPPLSGGLDR